MLIEYCASRAPTKVAPPEEQINQLPLKYSKPTTKIIITSAYWDLKILIDSEHNKPEQNKINTNYNSWGSCVYLEGSYCRSSSANLHQSKRW
jgi:hypothetical protein